MSDSTHVPFEELYAQRQWVRALALRLVRDPGAADDVEQQTWIAAIERPPRRGSVRAWLGTVVRSKAWKLRRSRERRARHEEASAPRNDDRAPDDVVAAAEVQRRVVDAVMALDEPYRATVLLRFFEDLPPSEISRRMNAPLETVRTRLRRAADLLRARLDGEFEDRRAWAVPLLGIDLFREAARATPSGAAAAIGATLMTAKQVALAIVAVVALAGVAVVATSDANPKTPSGASVAANSPETETRAKRRGVVDLAADAAGVASSQSPAAASAPEIDRARDLHGEVVSTDGAPITGATLRIETLVAVTSTAGTSAVASAKTGPDGRFAFRLVPGEIVNVNVEAPGRARLLASGLQPGEHLRVVLPKAMRLVVSVRGSDGGPAAGVALRLAAVVNPLTTTLQLATQEATTDESGAAVFNALAAGADVRVNAWPVERDAPGSATLTLPSKDEASMTIALTRGADLRGRVYDARNGQGVAAARVSLSTGIGANRTASTAADGTFQITGDDATRSSWLRVTAPGYVASNVEASATKFAEAPLRVAIPVTARIVDESGAPIAGALVTLVANSAAVGPGGELRTDADGRVRLDGLADDARGLVVVSARGLATANVNIVPQPGARERDLGDIRLSAGTEVAGVVLRTDGKPAARAAVWLLAVGGGLRFSDDLGRYRFPNVAAGDGRIGAADGGQPSRMRTVQVVAGQPLAVTLVIEARRDLRVEVLDDAGRPTPGVEFTVQSMDQQLSKAITGADGIAHAQVTGRASVRFVESGSRVLCSPTNRIVRPSQDVVRFVAIAAGRSSGVIVGTDGQPLAGAQFDVRSGAKFLGRLWADAQGRFDVLVPAGVPASVELVAQPAAGRQLDDKLLGGRIEFAAGSTDLTLRAAPVDSGGSLTVRVLTPDGAPVAGARVVASGPVSHFQATSDVDGRARLAGLPVRELSVMALAVSGWQTPVPRHATPAGQEITLTLRAASSVAGRVVDADGKPVARASVVVEDASGAERWNGSTDADGRFRVEFPADIAAPLAINVQLSSFDSVQDAWLENVAPGASGLEIVVR